ncbi:hypothetical protein IFR05_016936 [Cadophora sp. M221]|nr:hypothetical protein IFR05_016936 [Cadophora sp. M221]
MVVEAAPDCRGVDVDMKVGRIIELVLLSVNLGIETDDDDVEEDVRLPAVCIDDEGSRSDAGPVNVLAGDEAIRRDDGVGVSSGVDEEEDLKEENVDGSMLVEGVVDVTGDSRIEELDFEDAVSAAELAIDESLEGMRLDTGVVKVSSCVDPVDDEPDALDEEGISEAVVNVSEATADEDDDGSTLVLGVVKVDSGTPVSSPILELDPSTGIIVTAGDPAAASPIPTEVVVVVDIGVDVFENAKLRARL